MEDPMKRKITRRTFLGGALSLCVAGPHALKSLGKEKKRHFWHVENACQILMLKAASRL